MYCHNCMKKIREGTLCTSCMIESNYESMVHHLKPGTILNKKYFVGNVIGEGGFGITYIGFDTMLDIKVAIKEYFPNGYVNRNNAVTSEIATATEKQRAFFDKGKESFLVEARSIAKFSQEQGIVDVRDYFEENGTAYIIMEYLDGQTLADYVKQNGNMDTKQLFMLMKPVMRSLQKVHSAGIVHRDISPDNIMYLKNGTFKLMDFGAARCFTNEEKHMSVVLKMGYAPEEQYRKNGVQGPWTDVYGMCATMYRCITGAVPDDALDRLHTDSLKKPSELGIEIPDGYEVILMYGLAVYREDRCKDMAELLDLTDKVHKKEKLDLHQNKQVSSKDLYKTQAADDDYHTQVADGLYDEELPQHVDDNGNLDMIASELLIEAEDDKSEVSGTSSEFAKKEVDLEEDTRASAICIGIMLICIVLASVWMTLRTSNIEKLMTNAKSISDYQEIIEKYPKEENAYVELAQLYMENSEYDMAYEMLDRGLSLTHDDSKFYGKMVKCYLMQNKVEEALAFVEDKSGEIDLDLYTPCHMQNVYNLIQDGNYQQAISNYEETLDNGLLHYYQEGESLEQSAIDVSKQCFRVDPYGDGYYGCNFYIGYLNEIGLEEGQGREIGIRSDGTGYYVIDGVWQDGKLTSGTFTCSVTDTHTNGNTWMKEYSGNVQNSHLHGDIMFGWQMADGTNADSGVIHADNGNIQCIRQENEKYVYVEGQNTGWYWYMNSEEGLQGWQVEDLL